ncbi:MAG: hypothetical protein AB7F28_05665 [Candidatus Margulisiibacteriota bacterium]
MGGGLDSLRRSSSTSSVHVVHTEESHSAAAAKQTASQAFRDATSENPPQQQDQQPSSHDVATQQASVKITTVRGQTVPLSADRVSRDFNLGVNPDGSITVVRRGDALFVRGAQGGKDGVYARMISPDELSSLKGKGALRALQLSRQFTATTTEGLLSGGVTQKKDVKPADQKTLDRFRFFQKWANRGGIFKLIGKIGTAVLSSRAEKALARVQIQYAALYQAINNDLYVAPPQLPTQSTAQVGIPTRVVMMAEKMGSVFQSFESKLAAVEDQLGSHVVQAKAVLHEAIQGLRTFMEGLDSASLSDKDITRLTQELEEMAQKSSKAIKASISTITEDLVPLLQSNKGLDAHKDAIGRAQAQLAGLNQLLIEQGQFLDQIQWASVGQLMALVDQQPSTSPEQHKSLVRLDQAKVLLTQPQTPPLSAADKRQLAREVLIELRTLTHHETGDSKSISEDMQAIVDTLKALVRPYLSGTASASAEHVAMLDLPEGTDHVAGRRMAAVLLMGTDGALGDVARQLAQSQEAMAHFESMLATSASTQAVLIDVANMHLSPTMDDTIGQLQRTVKLLISPDKLQKFDAKEWSLGVQQLRDVMYSLRLEMARLDVRNILEPGSVKPEAREALKQAFLGANLLMKLHLDYPEKAGEGVAPKQDIEAQLTKDRAVGAAFTVAMTELAKAGGASGKWVSSNAFVRNFTDQSVPEMLFLKLQQFLAYPGPGLRQSFVALLKDAGVQKFLSQPDNKTLSEACRLLSRFVEGKGTATTALMKEAEAALREASGGNDVPVLDVRIDFAGTLHVLTVTDKAGDGVQELKSFTLKSPSVVGATPGGPALTADQLPAVNRLNTAAFRAPAAYISAYERLSAVAEGLSQTTTVNFDLAPVPEPDVPGDVAIEDLDALFATEAAAPLPTEAVLGMIGPASTQSLDNGAFLARLAQADAAGFPFVFFADDAQSTSEPRQIKGPDGRLYQAQIREDKGVKTLHLSIVQPHFLSDNAELSTQVFTIIDPTTPLTRTLLESFRSIPEKAKQQYTEALSMPVFSDENHPISKAIQAAASDRQSVMAAADAAERVADEKLAAISADDVDVHALRRVIEETLGAVQPATEFGRETLAARREGYFQAVLTRLFDQQSTRYLEMLDGVVDRSVTNALYEKSPFRLSEAAFRTRVNTMMTRFLGEDSEARSLVQTALDAKLDTAMALYKQVGEGMVSHQLKAQVETLEQNMLASAQVLFESTPVSTQDVESSGAVRLSVLQGVAAGNMQDAMANLVPLLGKNENPHSLALLDGFVRETIGKALAKAGSPNSPAIAAASMALISEAGQFTPAADKVVNAAITQALATLGLSPNQVGDLNDEARFSQAQIDQFQEAVRSGIQTGLAGLLTGPNHWFNAQVVDKAMDRFGSAMDHKMPMVFENPTSLQHRDGDSPASLLVDTF